MVWYERQRRASTCPAPSSAAVGQASTQRRQLPQRSAVGPVGVGVDLQLDQQHRQHHPRAELRGDQAPVARHDAQPGPGRPHLLHERAVVDRAVGAEAAGAPRGGGGAARGAGHGAWRGSRGPGRSGRWGSAPPRARPSSSCTPGPPPSSPREGGGGDRAGPAPGHPASPCRQPCPRPASRAARSRESPRRGRSRRDRSRPAAPARAPSARRPRSTCGASPRGSTSRPRPRRGGSPSGPSRRAGRRGG